MNPNEGSQKLRFASSLTLALLAVTWTSAGAQQSPAASTVTFAEDVAPILYQNCVHCHRPGSIAPMSLLTYDETRPWAAVIRDRVEKRKMPPWFIERDVGIQEFRDDKGLSEEDVATIVRWAESGALPGDLSRVPPTPTFNDDVFAWTLEQEMGRPPDLIVPIPEPFLVKANGPNWWMTFESPTGLQEDRWVQAFETKPSIEGFPVVHHAVTRIQLPDGSSGGFFSEYALGKTSDINPDGTGLLLKAGTSLIWNLHYASSPDEEDRVDRTSIAIWFFPDGVEPKHELLREHWADNADLDIPPGESYVRTDGYEVLTDNVRITSFQPHLHNVGTRQCLDVIYSTGQIQTLSCAGWDFGWHINYNYEDHVQPLIPKGSVVRVTSWHNNSESNPWATDTENWVGFGQRSTDDMSFAWIGYYKLTDEEFDAAVQERAAQSDR